MRKISTIAIVAVMGIILGSCGNSNNVVSNKLISKRKYTKGFHFNQKGHFKSGQDVQDDQEYLTASVDQDNYTIQANDFKPRAVQWIATTSSNSILPIQDREHDSERGSTSQKAAFVNTEKHDRSGFISKSQARKDVVKKQTSKRSAPNDDTVMLILLVILAIIIPPLAVFIYEGATSRFWIDLILAILGWGIGFWLLGGLGFIAGLAAIIYALLIVLEVI